MPDSWPLVGRDRELALLLDACRRRRGGAVVVGDAGVGKTRLVTEALSRLQSDGVRTEWTRATTATRAIRLGALSPIVGPLEDAASPDEVVPRALEHLGGRGGSEGLVLAVDDAHLLDEASVALVHLAATQGVARVLLTIRTGQDVPSTLVGLWKDDVIARLDVAPLGRQQTERLVTAVLGDRVPTSFVERVWDLSHGNALFVRELVVGERERRGTGERPGAEGAAAGNRRLRDLVEERLGLLDEEARNLLELVAVGEQVPLAVVERLAPSMAIETLERRNLLSVRGDGGACLVEVTHPLYGEVVRAGLPAVRRRALLRALADATASEPGFDALRIATWRLEAGQEDDLDRLVALAREAAARFDYPLAERLARHVEAHGHRQAPLLLGEALAGQGRAEAAEACYAEFSPETAEERARWAVARSRNLFWGLSDVDRALAVASEAEATLTGTPNWQLECRSLRAQFLLYGAQTTEARRVAESVLEHPEARDAARVRALATTSVLWPAFGEGKRLLAFGEEWFDAARRVRDEVPFGELQLRMTRTLALVWMGRFVEAQQFAQADLGLAVRHAPPPLRGILEGLKGGTAFMRGHMWEARARLEAAQRAFSEGDWFGLRPWAAAFRVRAAIFTGDVEAAQRALADATAAYETDPARSAFALPDIELSRAWLDAGQGFRTEAIDRCRALGALLRGLALPLAAEALHALARLGRPEEAVAPLGEIAAASDAAIVAAYEEHARALVGSDPVALEGAARRFEALGADLLAAEGFRAAANAYGRSGLGASAHEAARRCDALLHGCGNPVSAALDPEAVFGERLTEREREVATLAAQGLTSPQIAERLSLSVRTVDTHLSRAYRKLLIDGRHELAGALGIEPRRP